MKKTYDILQELQHMRADVSEPSREWEARTRNRLTTDGKSRAGRLRRFRLVGLGAATAAVGALAVVAVGVLPPSGSEGGPVHPETAAAAVLREAAANVENLPAYEETQDGKYIFTRTHTRTMLRESAPPSSEWYEQAAISERWQDADTGNLVRMRQKVTNTLSDGTPRSVETKGVPQGSDGWAEYEVDGASPPLPPLPNRDLKSHPLWNPTVETLVEAPRDKDALADYIREYVEQGGMSMKGDGPGYGVGPTSQDVKVFGVIMQLLLFAEPILPAEVRESLLLIAAEIPEVATVKDKVDIQGRSGVVLGLDNIDHTAREEYVLDKETSQLLEYRVVQLSPSEDSDYNPPGLSGSPEGVIFLSKNEAHLVNTLDNVN